MADAASPSLEEGGKAVKKIFSPQTFWSSSTEEQHVLLRVKEKIYYVFSGLNRFRGT